MSSSKRMFAVLTLVGINAILAISGLSLATKGDLLSSNGAPLTGEVNVLDGAILAKTVISHSRMAAIEPRIVQTVVTAYSSSIDETDDTPFITASGSIVRSGVAASSFLPLGTKFRIPRLFGEKVFVVEDRMNSRYDGSKFVDIWFETKSEALNFGRKSTQIEIM